MTRLFTSLAFIEYNHIHHVSLETSDTGAVYTGGRNWLGSRGTVIRHNYFHDILGYGFENGRWVSPHFAWGIYLDDNSGGVDVMGNIVARAPRGLIHLHNGRDNHIDNNLVWHRGQPVLTGQSRPGRQLSRNQCPNPGFEQGTPGRLPARWRWQIRPSGKSRAGIVRTDPAAGRHALRIDADFVKQKARNNYPIVVSDDLTMPPGHFYRLAAKFKATQAGLKAALSMQSYVPGDYFWASRPNNVVVGTRWKNAEFFFRTPAPGDSNWHDNMKQFRVRIDFPAEYKRRSAEYWPERFTMPLAIAVGGQDKTVPPDSTLRLAKIVKTLGNKHVLVIRRDQGGHSTNYHDATAVLQWLIDDSR